MRATHRVDMEQVDYKELTRATETIESTHLAVVNFAHQSAGRAVSEIDKAIGLYYAVRDGIRYDPYQINLTVEGMKASTTLSTSYGWCVSKSVLLAACCRAIGIPARLGFADVKNHLSTARLRARMRTDVFYWHGYTEMRLGGRWVKATPAFNIELCDRFRLLPLEFDGQNDSLYHPYDAAGNRHMEYVNNRGVYSDLPLKEITQTFQQSYNFTDMQTELTVASFDEDVVRESKL
jgi:transglutaminase-like putative cysteine protease